MTKALLFPFLFYFSYIVIVYLLRENSYGTKFIDQAIKNEIGNGEYVLIMVETNHLLYLDESNYKVQGNWSSYLFNLLTDFVREERTTKVIAMLNRTFVLAPWVKDLTGYQQFQKAAIKETIDLFNCYNKTLFDDLNCGISSSIKNVSSLFIRNGFLDLVDLLFIFGELVFCFEYEY